MISLEKQVAIFALNPLSARVYLSLLNQLYAEPGFSDVDSFDLAEDLALPEPRIKGAITALNRAGLTTSERIDGLDHNRNNFIYAKYETDEEKTELQAFVMMRICQLPLVGELVKRPYDKSLRAAKYAAWKAAKTAAAAPAPVKYADQFTVAEDLGVSPLEVSPVTEDVGIPAPARKNSSRQKAHDRITARNSNAGPKVLQDLFRF